MLFVKKIYLTLTFLVCFLKKQYNLALNICQKLIEKSYYIPKKPIIDYDSMLCSIGRNIILSNQLSAGDSLLTNNFYEPQPNKLLILNSEIYDMGGHTEAILRFVEVFKNEYNIDFLITSLYNSSNNLAPVKSLLIKNNVNSFIELPVDMSYEKKVMELFNAIIANRYSAIFVNIHMQDVVSCAVLGVLHKYTKIKIIFYNHADHMFSLGTSFADLILTRVKNNRALSPYLYDNKNVQQILFCVRQKDKSEKKLQSLKLRQMLNIPENAFVTLSGGDSFKFGKSYFKLIKKILKKHENVYHICVSNFSTKDKQKIEKYLNEKQRFKLIKYVTDFDQYICMGDLFIDSYTQGAALTLVDCIKCSTPVVVRVNEEEPLKSFESYLFDYEFKGRNLREMFEKISLLVTNREKYNIAVQDVKRIFKNNYDIEVVKLKYKEILNG